MADKLAGGGARIREPQVIANVIETGLEDLQHLFAGDATALEGALINSAELPLHQAVVIAQLLLFDQTQTIIGVLAARLGAMDAGAVVAALQIFRGAEDGPGETA